MFSDRARTSASTTPLPMNGSTEATVDEEALASEPVVQNRMAANDFESSSITALT